MADDIDYESNARDALSEIKSILNPHDSKDKYDINGTPTILKKIKRDGLGKILKKEEFSALRFTINSLSVEVNEYNSASTFTLAGIIYLGGQNQGDSDIKPSKDCPKELYEIVRDVLRNYSLFH